MNFSLRKKTFKGYTANYQILMEPELKMRLMELKTFHDIDCPEHVRELIRDWVSQVEEQLNITI